MTEKRFVTIDNGEVYYITDTKDLKTLDDYINEFSKAEYEFTDEEVLSVAKEEYWQMIYENSMSAEENVNTLNNLFEENEQLKTELKGIEELLKSYRKTIEHNAGLLADATKKGYLPPWNGDVE